MAFSFQVGGRSTIKARMRDDALVRMQEKYQVYYHTFERQEGTRVWKDGREYVMLSSNDYLGLSDHPRLIAAGKRALEQWGTGTTGARLANGSRAFHRDLEAQLAAFLGKEDCQVHAAGYLSCLAAVAGFAQRGDLIVADKNVHSSLLAGIALADTRVERFRHNDPAGLVEVLQHEKEKTPKMIVFEGVYSMEGHIAPVREIVGVAREFDCFLVMDDAHGFGVLGRDGRGTADHFGRVEEIDIVCGSFSKSLAGTGGFVAGSKEAINYLRTHSKQTIFSAALAPVQAATAAEALRVMAEEPEHRERLWANTRRYREMLLSHGLDIWESETPAVPIVLGSKERAYYFWRALLEKGVFTVISIAPGVPPGKDLIRTAVSARHTEKDFAVIEAAVAYAVSKM